MSMNFVVFQLILAAVIAFASPSKPKALSVDEPVPMYLLYGDPTIIAEEDELIDPYLEYLRENFKRGNLPFTLMEGELRSAQSPWFHEF
ncbi:hypothetical protein ECG_00189 [Echinococcus granulosus]|nr:hypothetical protein ECG_00189 [Echinococcus granulosus]